MHPPNHTMPAQQLIYSSRTTPRISKDERITNEWDINWNTNRCETELCAWNTRQCWVEFDVTAVRERRVVYDLTYKPQLPVYLMSLYVYLMSLYAELMLLDARTSALWPICQRWMSRPPCQYTEKLLDDTDLFNSTNLFKNINIIK